MWIASLRVAAVCQIVISMGAVAAAQSARPPGPCRQIVAACQEAGFTQGGARSGEGLVVDCIRPIMQGVAQRRRASKPAPQIEPQLVEACKAVNPKFGQANPPPPSASPAETSPPSPPSNAPPPVADGPPPH